MSKSAGRPVNPSEFRDRLQTLRDAANAILKASEDHASRDMGDPVPVAQGDLIITAWQVFQDAINWFQNYWATGPEFVADPRTQEAMEPIETRALDPPLTVRAGKGSIVSYHDPISCEECVAIVVKVLPAGRVNLVFFTEEGAYNSQCDVPYGPGRMNHWW